MSAGDYAPVSWHQRDEHGLKGCLAQTSARQKNSTFYRIPDRGIQITQGTLLQLEKQLRTTGKFFGRGVIKFFYIVIVMVFMQMCAFLNT